MELLNAVGVSNHGRFGYHLRTLRAFVELEPSTGKYRLTERGRLLVGLIRDSQAITAMNKEYTRYVQELGIGDHALALYATEDFKREISFSFIKAGLLKEEAVLYLVLENKLDLEVREIQKYGIDLGQLQKGAFTIMSAYEWFIERGKAQAETIIANWLELNKQKKKAGFTGLRVAGETAVFFDYAKSNELLRYEELLGRQLETKMCGLCLYDGDRLNEEQFIRAYNAHGHIIQKGVVGKTLV